MKEKAKELELDGLYKLNKDGWLERINNDERNGNKLLAHWLGFKPEEVQKHQTDFLWGNLLIECKLDENEGGGVRKAYQELYYTYPARIQDAGDPLPFYRAYLELTTLEVEVYDNKCILLDKFNWLENRQKLLDYIADRTNVITYSLLDEHVDLVEVYEKIYKGLLSKEERDYILKSKADKIITEGVLGWFLPATLTSLKEKLIKDREKMSEKHVRKKAGEFFTPPQYAKISADYVMNAITDAKKEGYDDYVIVDRCAGVGNLEIELPEETWSHLIMGTIQEADANIVNIRFDGKAECKVIDALSKEGVEYYKEVIEERRKQFKKLAVIFYENPPYSEAQAGATENNQTSKTNKTYARSLFTGNNNDLDSVFINTANKIYKCYQYVHFGPVKTWKTLKQLHGFIEGYLSNRKYYNANESTILIARWNFLSQEDIIICGSDYGKRIIKKVYKNSNTFLVEKEGTKNCGEIADGSFIPDFKHCRLADKVSFHAKTFKLNENNLLNNIVAFVHLGYEPKDYTEKEVIMKSADGGTAYQQDQDFLHDCMFWTLLTNKNKCSKDCEIYPVGWELLEKYNKDKYFNNPIKEVYDNLYESSDKTHGLANIEIFQKSENGKLWSLHNLYPLVKQLKEILKEFYAKNIEPKLFKYELLK